MATISVGSALYYAALIGAAYVAVNQMKNMEPPKQPDMTAATPIDKTALQAAGKVDELELGEDAEKKALRRKGKAAFKVQLDEEARANGTQEKQIGVVSAAKPEQLGVQL